MLANKTLPEAAPQATPEIESRSASDGQRMLCGFTAVLLGKDTYFQEIEAQVDLALARQNGPRQ